MAKRKRKPSPGLAYAQRMGRIGGKLGGKIRAASMTPEERRESAQKAAKARWAKVKETAGQ